MAKGKQIFSFAARVIYRVGLPSICDQHTKNAPLVVQTRLKDDMIMETDCRFQYYTMCTENAALLHRNRFGLCCILKAYLLNAFAIRYLTEIEAYLVMDETFKQHQQ